MGGNDSIIGTIGMAYIRGQLRGSNTILGSCVAAASCLTSAPRYQAICAHPLLEGSLFGTLQASAPPSQHVPQQRRPNAHSYGGISSSTFGPSTRASLITTQGGLLLYLKCCSVARAPLREAGLARQAQAPLRVLAQERDLQALPQAQHIIHTPDLQRTRDIVQWRARSAH